MTVDEIRKALAKVSPGIDWSGVQDDASLEEAGLDSLDKASLVMEIESHAGISIDDDSYDKLSSIKDIQTFLT